MKDLFKKLEANHQAEQALDTRYKETLTSTYWKFAGNKTLVDELIWITKIQKRIYSMRQRLLDNIQLETTKQMHSLSQKQRTLNTNPIQS